MEKMTGDGCFSAFSEAAAPETRSEQGSRGTKGFGSSYMKVNLCNFLPQDVVAGRSL